MKNKLFITFLVAGICALGCLSAGADEAAEKILGRARYAAALQQQDLQGYMKKNGKKTSIALFLRGKNIQFQYRLGKRYEKFHLRMNKNQYDLFSFVGNKTVKFNNRKLSERINDTDLTFEDLSMRFLYWKNSKIEGEERISGQKCYKIRLVNSSKYGSYRYVYVWVHKKYGALMRVMGFDAKGKAIKQFQVTDLMKVGKEYTLERMRVDSKSGKKVLGTTYLEFQKPNRPAGARKGR